MRAMKDSGIEWIGEIPEGWKIVRIKQVFTITRGEVLAKTEIEQEPRPGLFPVYSSQTKNNGCLGYIPSYMIDKEGLTWTTDGANAGTVFLRRGKYNITNVCGLLTPKVQKNILPFLNYSVGIAAFHNRRQDINGYKIMSNEMAEIKIILPPPAEQQRIAAYLDEQCGEIDKVLAKTRESIEEYKKLKQAVITEAVTKGIRPDRPMKPSGIEWIGDIPAEWGMRRLRHLGCCQNGISKGAEFFDSGYPFVSYSDVYKNMELPHKVNGLVESTDEERERYSVLRGDIFFTRTSETIEEIGFTAVCLKTIPNATFAGFLIRVRPTTSLITPEFSKYYFRSDSHRCFFVKEMNLVTRASLGQELLKKLPVLLPPLDEQQEIVAYLDQQCAEIDRLIAKKEQIITELESYKKSLIYECVTGKREVAG